MKRMKSIMMMDNMNSSMMEATEFVVPESLFESLDQLDYGYDSGSGAEDSLLSELMDTDLMTSDTMTSFLEMEAVKEVESVKTMPPSRPSVIIKNTTKAKSKEPSLSLSEILTSCGIEYDLVEAEQPSPVASPASSLGSDMEKTQELIDELEDFFMKTEGSPTQVKEESLKLEDLDNAMTTSLVTEDGQKVVIILAPSSPTDSLLSGASSVHHDSGLDDTDPEWSPSPSSPQEPAKARPRKKYERTKKPKAPSTAPYPTDKKERKKAQNRTAAYRYREKMKEAENQVEEELEALEERNTNLKEQFAEMQTEFKYLKKLMTEAGLGHYAAAVNF